MSTANDVSALESAVSSLNSSLLSFKEYNTQNSNDFFLLVTGAFVYLMQFGFAFLEAGSVRYQNVTNTIFRNFCGTCVGCMAYWATGYAFAFGTQSNDFIGYSEFACAGIAREKYAFWFFELTFALAATSIVSGGIAERCDVWSYFVYCTVMPGFIYAVVTHWCWAGDGWLVTLKLGTYTYGFQDFAGSGAVHVCGGLVAMMGAIILGPRIGRFTKKAVEVRSAYIEMQGQWNNKTPDTHHTNGAGKYPRQEVVIQPVSQPVIHAEEMDMDTRGHSVPVFMIGVFMLMFAFIGFNGGSLLHVNTGAGDGPLVAQTVVNTIVCGSFAGFSCFLAVRIFKKKWTLIQTGNAVLAGMVSICSGCNVMYSWSAAVTGLVAGLIYFGLAILVPKLKIDDPMETIALHFGGGTWGLIATALFDFNHGIVFFGSGRDAWLGLAVQMIGFAAIFGWTCITAGIMFGIMRLLKIFRISEETEIHGIDMIRHNEPAYPYLNDMMVANNRSPRLQH